MGQERGGLFNKSLSNVSVSWVNVVFTRAEFVMVDGPPVGCFNNTQLGTSEAESERGPPHHRNHERDKGNKQTIKGKRCYFNSKSFTYLSEGCVALGDVLSEKRLLSPVERRMLRLHAICSLILVLCSLNSAAFSADQYRIDPEHVSVNFTTQHAKWARYQGTIRSVGGMIMFDRSDVSKSSVTVHMKAKDIDTLNGERDQELQGIMNVAKNPDIDFVSTSVEKTGEKTGKIVGNLAMARVTKSVTLSVTFSGEGVSGWDGMNRVGFSATGSLDTNEYGMATLKSLEIGPKLDFTIEVEAVKP